MSYPAEPFLRIIIRNAVVEQIGNKNGSRGLFIELEDFIRTRTTLRAGLNRRETKTNATVTRVFVGRNLWVVHGLTSFCRFLANRNLDFRQANRPCLSGSLQPESL